MSSGSNLVSEAIDDLVRDRPDLSRNFLTRDRLSWPVSNVWVGTSIESDHFVSRADALRAIPAATRFLSLEPLLGPLPSLNLSGIDWVIAGGSPGQATVLSTWTG